MQYANSLFIEIVITLICFHTFYYDEKLKDRVETCEEGRVRIQ